jgi:hypothetical protein
MNVEHHRNVKGNPTILSSYSLGATSLLTTTPSRALCATTKSRRPRVAAANGRGVFDFHGDPPETSFQHQIHFRSGARQSGPRTETCRGRTAKGSDRVPIHLGITNDGSYFPRYFKMTREREYSGSLLGKPTCSGRNRMRGATILSWKSLFGINP